MKRLTVGVIICAMIAMTLAADAPERKPLDPKLVPENERNLSGFYAFDGKENDEPYEGVVTVSGYSPTYKIRWIMADGANFEGIGYDDGKQFIVSWAAPLGTTPGGRLVLKYAVNIYTIEPGGKLVGRWTTGKTFNPENWLLLRKGSQ